VEHRCSSDVVSLYPRGPRSGAGYSVPLHPRLIGPMRPSRKHTATSSQGDLYAVPSLCGCALAARERFRAFAIHSVPTCRPLRPRSARSGPYPVPSAATLAFDHPLWPRRARHPHHPLPVGLRFRGLWVRIRYNLPGCLPPWRIRPGHMAQPTETCTPRLSNGSVALPAVGYHYDGIWVLPSVELSSTRTFASFAALSGRREARVA